MVTSRLFLTGITCSGRHGANPGEKDRPQDFVVDLDVEVETGGDALAQTADYRSVIRTARATVEGESFDLLESLVAAVANAVLALDGVRKVAPRDVESLGATTGVLREIELVHRKLITMHLEREPRSVRVLNELRRS